MMLSLFGNVGSASTIKLNSLGAGRKQGVLDIQKSVFNFENHSL